MSDDVPYYDIAPSSKRRGGAVQEQEKLVLPDDDGKGKSKKPRA